MNLVGIFCLHSGTLLQAAHGDRQTHETKLFQQLWGALRPGDLVLADRGFCSFGAIAGLATRGVDSLMRLPEKKIRVAIGSQLPKNPNFDVTITWKRPAQRPPGMASDEFDLLPESITVRAIRYTVAYKGFRSQSVTLVTTLLDPSLSAADLADLYFRRWGVELHFREIKIHLNMDVLRCKSPHMIERELRMHFIAYNLIRCLMQKAALTHDVDLQRISFKGALDSSPICQCRCRCRGQTQDHLRPHRGYAPGHRTGSGPSPPNENRAPRPKTPTKKLPPPHKTTSQNGASASPKNRSRKSSQTALNLVPFMPDPFFRSFCFALS